MLHAGAVANAHVIFFENQRGSRIQKCFEIHLCKLLFSFLFLPQSSQPDPEYHLVLL